MTTTPPIPKTSSGRAVQGAVNSPVAATVVIPYFNREQHLLKSLDGWFAQDYAGHLGIVVVDFSDKPTAVDLNRVRLVRSQNTRWNISRANNLGARTAAGDLLIFAHADMLVEPDFASSIMQQWDQFSMWVCDGIIRNIPHDPSLDSLIAVKRWVNTRIRGFNEEMMENPHGWGYDATDYRLRAEQMLSSCGETIGGYSGSSVMHLSHDDLSRMEPYDHHSLDVTRDQHADYSRWYRGQIGFEANIGHDWGQPW